MKLSKDMWGKIIELWYHTIVQISGLFAHKKNTVTTDTYTNSRMNTMNELQYKH